MRHLTGSLLRERIPEMLFSCKTATININKSGFSKEKGQAERVAHPGWLLHGLNREGEAKSEYEDQGCAEQPLDPPSFFFAHVDMIT